MKSLKSFDRIYLYHDFVDMRRSIDGLSQIVNEEMELDIYGLYLFVFMNRSRDRLKILHWDETGFAIWYKRLEKNRFKWTSGNEESIETSALDLERLLADFNIFEKPHEKLKYLKINRDVLD